jgi:ribbon-helix-helix CopG family protein
MKKTSVYLTEEEAGDLRRLAVREGKPQAELIRDGVRRVIADAAHKPRAFRSLGMGRGGGEAVVRWDPSKVYDKAMGKK